MNLTIAYWAVGLLTIFGHLWRAVANEPGTWADFFRDKKNVTYLIISASTAITLLISYAATDGTQTPGAIMFAASIGFGSGSVARAIAPSEVAKERGVEQKRVQVAKESGQ